MSVNIAVRGENGAFYFRPAVYGLPEGVGLDTVDGPQLTVQPDGTILWPMSEGACIPPEQRYPDRECFDVDRSWGRYPGYVQMQFMAWFRDGRGVYFGAHDPACTPKRIMPYGKPETRLALECRCCAWGEYVSPFEYALVPFRGDWFKAAEIYRDWLENTICPQKPFQPDWLEDSPVVVTYAVCGNGLMSGVPNEFIPYRNALPCLLEIAEAADSRVMAHLMRWDRHGPWTPPYLWPPRGGAESLREFRDELHCRGHLLGLYGSGAAWTLRSLVSDYKAPAGELEKAMICGPDRKVEQWDFSGIREQMHFCITEEAGRKIMLEEALKIASEGIDFLQLFDQDMGGLAAPCYAEGHCHPPLPGPHETAAARSLYREIGEAFRSAGYETVLGTEGAAAEPYVAEFPFNDLRPLHTIGAVPLYSFVFHRYVNNFSGNQAMNCFDPVKSPENLLYRIAYGFSTGALLTIPMRGKGEIDWGAGTDWKLSPPDKKQVLTLVRNLNSVRKKYPQFLRFGKMIPPVSTVSGEKYTLHFIDGRPPREVDSFFASAWEAPDGARALILTNFLPREQSVTVGGRSIRIPPLSACVMPQC